MNKINVGGVEQFSLVDYPEKIAATIFMQGCPWRCPFCHNETLQSFGVDTHFIWEKFISFLSTRTRVLDAVVFSGGEPLMQDGLPDAVSEVKSLGFKIGLHTGGYRPQMLEKVLPLVDWVGFDIKAPFVEAHYQKAIGGVKHLKQVETSLDMLLNSSVDFECRTTCDPRLLDIADVLSIGQSLKSKGVKEYYLQKYRPIPSDNITQDADCEKFFINHELLSWMNENFSKFDVRK